MVNFAWVFATPSLYFAIFAEDTGAPSIKSVMILRSASGIPTAQLAEEAVDRRRFSWRVEVAHSWQEELRLLGMCGLLPPLDSQLTKTSSFSFTMAMHMALLLSVIAALSFRSHVSSCLSAASAFALSTVSSEFTICNTGMRLEAERW